LKDVLPREGMRALARYGWRDWSGLGSCLRLRFLGAVVPAAAPNPRAYSQLGSHPANGPQAL